MGDLRALIKEILAEELNSLRSELAGQPAVERVNVATPSELNRFALSLLDRASDPQFVSALRNGLLRFEPVRNSGMPERTEQAPPPAPAGQTYALTTTLPPTVPQLAKNLITERDIAAIPNGETRLRITKTARLTPLANDEARRRGIRIERTIA